MGASNSVTESEDYIEALVWNSIGLVPVAWLVLWVLPNLILNCRNSKGQGRSKTSKLIIGIAIVTVIAGAVSVCSMEATIMLGGSKNFLYAPEVLVQLITVAAPAYYICVAGTIFFYITRLRITFQGTVFAWNKWSYIFFCVCLGLLVCVMIFQAFVYNFRYHKVTEVDVELWTFVRELSLYRTMAYLIIAMLLSIIYLYKLRQTIMMAGTYKMKSSRSRRKKKSEDSTSGSGTGTGAGGVNNISALESNNPSHDTIATESSVQDGENSKKSNTSHKKAEVPDSDKAEKTPEQELAENGTFVLMVKFAVLTFLVTVSGLYVQFWTMGAPVKQHHTVFFFRISALGLGTDAWINTVCVALSFGQFQNVYKILCCPMHHLFMWLCVKCIVCSTDIDEETSEELMDQIKSMTPSGNQGSELSVNSSQASSTASNVEIQEQPQGDEIV